MLVSAIICYVDEGDVQTLPRMKVYFLCVASTSVNSAYQLANCQAIVNLLLIMQIMFFLDTLMD